LFSETVHRQALAEVPRRRETASQRTVMWRAFEKALTRHAELETLLADPVVIADRARYTRLAKEHGALLQMVKPYLEYRKLTDDIAQAEILLGESGGEMHALIEEELNALRPRQQALHDRLEDLLLTEGEDYGGVIMEIRAGTGGDEAAIFAGDLYRMYTQYARDQGWKVEEISFAPGEQGGYKEIVFSVTGDEVYQHLRYESGGHRVQRVPKTETQGRIHTSAATVAVLPEPDEVQIDVKDQDIEWERMRAGGAGGQHVNKTESAVRIWYKRGTPEEMEVKCQDERSQHKNYDRAMRILRSRLYERQQQALHNQRAEARRTLIGSGDRSERIRTYNYPQNRLTDHRINLTLYKLDAIAEGNLTEVIQALKDFDKKQRLASGDLPGEQGK
jgi:peptide chain release factor 1